MIRFDGLRHAIFRFAVALFDVKKKQTPEEMLFKHSPEHIQKLRRQATREKRDKARKEWYERNRN